VKLSVVVPIYNVEAYLQAALTSIAQQTLRDLEVIMVDDGSADGSASIAKSFAASDPRFRLLQQDNQGQGPARNLGVQHATGDYITFLDADDLVPRDAYDLLVGSLEKTGSDIAAGGVRRFSSGWVSPTTVHADVYRKTIPRTSVSQHQALLRDCTVWNKVYRRSFWNSAQLEFWAARYEDIPVCIRAYVLARSVDIRREIVYYWRARESGDLSRNQKSRELANVEGRMAAVSQASSIITQHRPALKPAFDRRVLDNDLLILLRTVEFVSEPDQQRLLEVGARYLRSVDDQVLRDTDAIARLQYHLMRKGMNAELLEVMRYSRRGDAEKAPLVRRGGKWYVGYPYFGDPTCGVPLHIYDASREMKLQVRLDAVSWQAGRLRIEGYAYIERLDAPREQDVRIDVLLRNTVLKRTLRLKVKRIRRPDVTARSLQAVACYDWCGFMAEINPARLSNLGTWRAVRWELGVRVRGHGIRREGPVRKLLPGSATWPEGRWLRDGIRLQPAAEPDGGFVILAERPGAVVTGCSADGDQLLLEGWSAAPLGTKAAIVVSLQQGGGKPKRVPAIATGTTFGRHDFRASVPITELLLPGTAGRQASGEGPLDRPGGAVVADDIHWNLSLDPGTGSAIRLAGEPGTAGQRAAAAGQEIATYVTPFGNFSAVQRQCRLVVQDASWTAAGRLLVRGNFLGTGAEPPAIMLRSTGSGYQHTVPLRWQDGMFTAHLSPGSMPGLAGELPLASGRWELYASTAAGETRVAADRRLLTQLPAPRQTGIHKVAVESYRGDALQVRVRLASADFGGYRQRKLAEWHHANLAGGRIDDVVVFDSHGGKQYSCNPRAIYEELRRRDTGLPCVWATRDGQFTVPDDSRVVVRDSREHYELAARARFLVSNMLQPSWYRRPDGQLYLQTWHGTPLKRIALDVERPQFSKGIAYHDRIRKDVAGWSALLSANTFSTPIFRRAFSFDGDILECGYPRNDLLRSPDSARRAEGIRRQLGLRADQRVVLYAPTWRDDATTRAAGYGFPLHLDLDRLAQALGPDHVTLVRAHQMMQEAMVTGVTDSRVLDVTIYPDMADLLLIADVLITDYSSAMFDFAVTGRPMLFFTYDLERYRDRLRGFYLDFEAEAPGPLLRTSDDVIEAIRSLEHISRGYGAAYDSFAAKFCSLEDGQAAVRAVDWLLSHGG
jgi:CDP-glycerol glycerophosphotransferase